MIKRALLLVEGQTEERFVKDVLAPEFYGRQCYLVPTLLVTKLVKNGPNFKGGVTNFAKFERDALRLLNDASGALVTTLLDYYGLPTDFPGMADRPAGTPLQRVSHVEAALSAHFGRPANFVPFLALHEYEAWLFASETELPRVMTDPDRQPDFATICRSFDTPEAINDQPALAPSKRIAALFPSYRKTLHGPNAVARIGLPQIRRCCQHFDGWMTRLEAFAAS